MGGTQLALMDEDRGGDPRFSSILTWTEYGGCLQTDHERAKTNSDSGEVPPPHCTSTSLLLHLRGKWEQIPNFVPVSLISS